MSNDIVILSGARTAIGTFGGSLSGMAPIDTATVAAKAAIDRAGVEAAQIGHVVFGHVINTEPRDMYLSRVAAIQAGIPNGTPAMNVNRLCGSGAQAIVSAAQAIALGDTDIAIGGSDHQRIALIVLRCLVEFGVEEGTLAVDNAAYPAANRRPVDVAVEDVHENGNAQHGLAAEVQFLRRNDIRHMGDAAIGGADDEIVIDRGNARRIAEEPGAPGRQQQADPEQRPPQPAEHDRDGKEDGNELVALGMNGHQGILDRIGNRHSAPRVFETGEALIAAKGSVVQAKGCEIDVPESDQRS